MTYTWLVLPGLVLCGPAQAEDATVWIALSDDSGAYAEAAIAAAAEIHRASLPSNVVTRPWSEFPGGSRPPRLVIAVGGQALAGISQSSGRAPVLAVLVAEAAYDRVVSKVPPREGPAAYSAVLLDQPPARQLAALRLALPERTAVGILFGPDSRRHAPAFRRAATEQGVRLMTSQVDAADSVGSLLRTLIEDTDILLAVADPLVFNSASIQNILTSAYRRRVPVAGFSPAYVRAGALLALYSTPTQIGRQAGEIARAFLSGRALPPPQDPRDFVIAISTDVARSLSLPLRAEDGPALATQLKARERTP